MITLKNSGYTIVELLIVLVIMGLAIGVGVANFRDFGRRQEVQNYGRTLIGDLRSTHSDAAAGRRVSGCTGTFQGYRIDFAAVAVSGGSRSTSYSIWSVCQTTSTSVKMVTLPTNLFLLINRNPTAGVVSILFKPLELGTDVSPASNLTLTISANLTSQTQVVSIGSSGEIK